MAKSPHGKAFERMATEIGYVCIHWSWLEDMVDYLIADLAKIDERGWSGNDENKAWHIITGNLDLRPKLQILRGLFFLRRSEHEEFFDHATEIINYIDNDLRPRRNHIVHSSLYGSGWQLKRQRNIVRITKPQAFKQPELKTQEVRPAKIAEARKLQKEIYLYAGMCGLMYGFATSLGAAKQRGLSFRQFLRRAKSWGHPTDKSSTQKRPRRLPQA